MKEKRETKIQKTKKGQRQKRTSGDKSYSESNKDKRFCCAFNLGFSN